MKKYIILILALLLLTSCYKMKSGIVIAKEFDPGHQEMYIQTVPVGKSFMSYPVYYTVHDRWYLKLQDGDHYKKIRVSEDDYNKCVINDRVQL